MTGAGAPSSTSEELGLQEREPVDAGAVAELVVGGWVQHHVASGLEAAYASRTSWPMKMSFPAHWNSTWSPRRAGTRKYCCTYCNDRFAARAYRRRKKG